MVDDKYIRDRITKLRMQKNVSEYKMSLDMGHSAGYIRSITSGKISRRWANSSICASTSA